MMAEAPIARSDGNVKGAETATREVGCKVIGHGSHVVLRDMEGLQKVAYIGNNAKDIRMGRYPPIPTQALLGLPYGAILRRSEEGDWQRQNPVSAGSGTAENSAEAPEEQYEHNAHLAQDGRAQTLSSSEVKALKSTVSGELVVEALATNSTSFASKTKFAQEKYLKKKERKHVQQVSLLRPGLLELCETYTQQCKAKVCGLRFDYLSSLVCQADVRRGKRYAVLDCACGLVMAAMARQMGGEGQIFRLFRGGCPDRALVELDDLGSTHRAVVRQLPIEVLASQEPRSHSWLQPLPPKAEASDAAASTETGPGEDAVKPATPGLERWKQRLQALESLLSQPVDALILVAGEDEAELVSEASEVGLRHLGAGGRLIQFGQQLQPLAAQQGVLRASGSFVDVRLHQLFTREYQVLPMRTHPKMGQDAHLSEGFILSATKVLGHMPEDVGDEGGAEGRKKRRRR